MKDAQKAASDLKAFISKIKPLIDLGEYFEEIGSIEQAKKDAEVKKAKAEKEFSEIKIFLEKKQEEFKKLESDCVISKAKSEEIVHSAKVKSQEILEECKSECEKIKFDASCKKVAAEKYIESKHNESSSLDKEIGMKRLELKEINDKIEELKNKLQSFMR